MEDKQALKKLPPWVAIVMAMLLTAAFHAHGQEMEEESGATGVEEAFVIPDTVSPGDTGVPVPPFDTIRPLSPLFQFFPTSPYADPDNTLLPTVDNPHSVGSIPWSFDVDGSGSAVYNVDIEVPTGGAVPRVGLVYNSGNARYGHAGHGFNISGFSSVTRGEKTLFNNAGEIGGVNYDSSDFLYLDGRRLVLSSGTAGSDGSEYSPEGDPYTRVTLHGDLGGTSPWFEAASPDGSRRRYGKEIGSKTWALSGGGYKVAEWHIDRMEDRHGDYAEYDYDVHQRQLLPLSITYGMNSARDRGLENRVDFEYENIKGASEYFKAGSATGVASKRLASITTSSNGQTYRRYRLSYDVGVDLGAHKRDRLVSVTEENGNGETLPPTTFTWSPLPQGEMVATTLPLEELPRVCSNDTIVGFLAVDLNGDGAADIVRIANFDTGANPTTFDAKSAAFVSCSMISDDGAVSYSRPAMYALPICFAIDDFINSPCKMSVMDIDGDGYNDLLFPYHIKEKGGGHSARCYVVLGGEIASFPGGGTTHMFPIELSGGGNAPLFDAFDADKDGKDEVYCLEADKAAGAYRMTTIKWDPETGTTARVHTPFNLPSKPERIFSGDYDNDGLPDMIVFHNDGYKIYFNQGGGVDAGKYSESGSYESSGLAGQWRMDQGDFNGDGLTDFVYNTQGESCLWTALNKGDGTFDMVKSDDTGVLDQTQGIDDYRFAMAVLDIDRDGLSDVVLCKDNYHYHGFPRLKSDYTETLVRWLVSDKGKLKLVKSRTKHREKDANETNIMLGDFDADGHLELANYGSDLLGDDTFDGKVLRVYRTRGSDASSGRLMGAADGMGNRVTMEYAYATNPSTHTAGRAPTHCYPVNSYALAVPVVSRSVSTDGAAGERAVDYRYGDFRLHLAGGGPLGFTETSRTDNASGSVETVTVAKMDPLRLVPVETRSTTMVDGASSSVQSFREVFECGTTYAVFETRNIVTDMDGNMAETRSAYDIGMGVLTGRTVYNDGGEMYKGVSYSGYHNYSGVWQPDRMTAIQKHADDPSPKSVTTVFAYYPNGDVVATSENDGTPMALLTYTIRDDYGNIVRTWSEGKGVASVSGISEYDPTGRFVTSHSTWPATTTTLRSYDHWGNLLTERVERDPLHFLETTHFYDHWGRRVSTHNPDGSESTVEEGWGFSATKARYTLERASEKPWKVTWYDAVGREVEVRTFGPNNVWVDKETVYDGQGRVSAVKNVVGRRVSQESYVYDGQGRLASVKRSPGVDTHYEYGNKRVTETTGSRSSTSVIDAWGNLLEKVDASGRAVKYVYGSNGQPREIRAAGGAVSLTYDDAGNRSVLVDPDAGETRFDYAADGKLMSKLDANGATTRYTYDNLGRLTKVATGSSVATRVYGTSGYGKGLLVSVSANGCAADYVYDRYGRVVEERRIAGGREMAFRYNFDHRNRLVSVVFPSGLEQRNEYDNYGFKTSVAACGGKVWELLDYDGTASVTAFCDSLTTTLTVNQMGLETSRRLSLSGRQLENMAYRYDNTNWNLLSRHRATGVRETFVYDINDRLVEATRGSSAMAIEYGADGNILYKTGVGEYGYNESLKPHAVAWVENESGEIPGGTLSTEFNDFGKIRRMVDEVSGASMELVYGPDRQRWLATVVRADSDTASVAYCGNYEIVEEGGREREYHYLEGGAIAVIENGSTELYLAYTDNLGSILMVVDTKGAAVFDADYDPWGVQEVRNNLIGLRRGYTGHEMLPEFGLVNMNGRFYDPTLGVFLSPDDYVQFPDDPSSYNRYSYCLNNPLKYTDPSGQFSAALLAAIPFAVFNTVSSMAQAAYDGQNVWKAGAIALLSSVASFGIGEMFKGGMSTCQQLLRIGTHGLSSGVMGQLNGEGFRAGLVSGLLAAGTGSMSKVLGVSQSNIPFFSASLGALGAFATGGDFVAGAMRGLRIGFLNCTVHFQGEKTSEMIDGELHVGLPECVVVEEARYSMISKSLGNAALCNTFIGGIGMVLAKNAGNSTYGSNNKFYFRGIEKRPFYGNQYVRTVSLKSMGNAVTKYTGPIGKRLSQIQVAGAIVMDGYNYCQNGNSDFYHTVTTSAKIAGSWVGGEMGFALGSKIGMSIGLCLGGVGVVPCTIIGGALGYFAGSWGGGYLSGIAVEELYDQF